MSRYLSVLALLFLALPLAAFADFTEVTEVCPSCTRPTADVVVLTSGAQVWCNVLAENDDYYVLERFGELRAAFKSEVGSIHWGPGRSAAELPSGDQILLKNDVLYHGTILSEDPGHSFTIQSLTAKQTPAVNMIRSVHKGKHAYSFQQAALPAAAPAKAAPAKAQPRPKKAPPKPAAKAEPKPKKAP
jgi:hypothetical protein